jgi:hypothetical protein
MLLTYGVIDRRRSTTGVLSGELSLGGGGGGGKSLVGKGVTFSSKCCGTISLCTICLGLSGAKLGMYVRMKIQLTTMVNIDRHRS